ncbi:hypothetical protein PF005_g27245 [Phytophthora fragariae]|uniref:Uncharacterized protein n=2 Tax=Phytophthora fragariae TaxID=53985 RepID=A0A6A3W0N0_9STRA|nr:hypothetical protein PF005_g27245 [Phytophthora fragariae]
MEPGSPPRQFGWGESDVEIMNYSSPKYALSSSRGPQLVKARLHPQPPAALTKKYPETITNRKENRATLFARSRLLYFQAFLAAVVLICLLWTIWLIFLNISPNYTVNLVMNTENFDDGSFWLFVNPPPATLYLAVTGLSVDGIGYIVVLLMIVFRPKRVMDFPPSALKTWVESTSRASSSALKLLNSLTQPDSTCRRFVKLWMKIGDLAFETILLVQILEAGSPAVIVGIFTVIIASNALVSAVMMLLPLNRMGLVDTLVGLL